MDELVLICECLSPDHQVIFYKDTEDGEIFISPHLTTHRNFFKRLWYGLKYAFGYKSRYGEWDSTIIKPEELTKLREFLESQNPNIEKSLQQLKDGKTVEYKIP